MTRSSIIIVAFAPHTESCPIASDITFCENLKARFHDTPISTRAPEHVPLLPTIEYLTDLPFLCKVTENTATCKYVNAAPCGTVMPKQAFASTSLLHRRIITGIPVGHVLSKDRRLEREGNESGQTVRIIITHV
jgi:hypothetical protein